MIMAFCVRVKDQYVVPVCPICGGTHFHGAGGDTPLGRRRSTRRGHRVKHCAVSQDVHKLGGYDLVEVRLDAIEKIERRSDV